MAIESERFDPDVLAPAWTRNEHLQRFLFASTFVGGKRVVDCACGVGLGSQYFAQAGAVEVVSIDISQAGIAEAAKRAGVGNPIRLIRADACRVPLRTESAEVFVSFETLEHLQAPEMLLDEALRVLRPGGFFICSTPNRHIYSPGHSAGHVPWNQFHRHEYSHEEFEAALSMRFRTCEFFGQNPCSLRRAAMLSSIGRLAPANIAVRLNQILKLPLLFFDTPHRHRVEVRRPDRGYEISVAVCRP